MACTKDCALRVSSPEDIARFFPVDVLASVAPSCVHNGVLAFCNVAARLAPEHTAYLLIMLAMPAPIPIRLKKVSAEKYPKSNQRDQSHLTI